MITPITPINSLPPILTASGSAVSPLEGGSMFGDIFRIAIENVKETDAEAVTAQYLLATGQLDNPAVSSIANSKYGIAVDMLIQFRNKALDAYSELMRISL